MLNETNNPKGTETQDVPTTSLKALRKKLNRIADQAAQRAANRLKRYDRDHGIFTR